MPINDPKLTAYALGELNPAEQAEMAAALAREPEQRQAVEEIRQCSDWLAGALQAETCPTLTPTQKENLWQSVPAPASRQRGSSRHLIKYWPYWLGAGLGAAACAIGLMNLFSDRPDAVSAVTPDVARRSTRQVTSATPSDRQTTSSGAIIGNMAQEPSLATASSPAKSGQLDLPHRLLAANATNPAFADSHQSIPGYQTPPPNAENAAMNAGPARSLGLAPLLIALPIPAFMGTPTDVPASEHLEPPSRTPRPSFMAPQGVKNVALNKTVTSSDRNPITGTLDLITDGDKESNDSSYVELHRKVQWVQIDLEGEYIVSALVVWHAHNTPQVYHAVIVQVADDADFTQNVRTLFNNDYENAVGLGAGTDKQYYENYEGRLIDGRGEKARHVRLYSKGSTFSALNRYTEVEVYALPAVN